MNSTARKILINIVSSLAFLSIPILSSPDFNSGKNLFEIYGFLKEFTLYFLLLVYFYLNYNFFLPKLLFRKKKYLLIVVTITSFLVIYFLSNFLLFPDYSSQIPKDIHKQAPPPKHFFNFINSGIFQFLFVFGLSYLLKINNRLQEIKQERQLAEISYLKAQINPHFLFNTLNSLYALTLEKSKDAPDAVLKLSSIMRYVVTESNQDFVSLEKEINYIKDYIDLQKLRIDIDTHLKVSIEGEPKGKIIAPLILIPFIENAFKYGINPDENSFIDIKITMDSDAFILSVANSIVNKNLSEEEKTATGIENTIKRLKYIYPKRHLLNLKEEEDVFNVNLTLFL